MPTPSAMALARQLGIIDDVQLYPNVNVEQLAELYRNASVFVLSSDEEGLGIVILEAMASGIPVVSTDCGGPSTAVEHGVTGFLTPVGNEEAMAVTLARLLKNVALRRHMGSNARRAAVEKFSTKVAGEKFLQKYEELLCS